MHEYYHIDSSKYQTPPQTQSLDRHIFSPSSLKGAVGLEVADAEAESQWLAGDLAAAVGTWAEHILPGTWCGRDLTLRATCVATLIT
jgi:hypothetical protein